jgi:seryl-tRNA synthetase
MLSVDFIRNSSDAVREGMEKRGLDPKVVDDFLRVDEEWRKVGGELDGTRAKQNELSKQLAGGKDPAESAGADHGARDALIAEAKGLKGKVDGLEAKKRKFGEERDEILNNMPNVPLPDVPVGSDESANKVLREEGKKPEFGFGVRDYLVLAEGLGIINVGQSAKVSGSRFGYLLGDAVLLEFALVRLAFDVLLKEGFQPIVPPVMIRPEVYQGMGRLAGDQKEERYYLEKEGLYLAGSSEHTVGPYQMGSVIPEEELPKRYAAFSTCFRREAGSYGRDTKGILRVHQFDKVEMFSFSRPDKSDEEHRFLLSMQERLMKELKLPYRVVEICTGDMGWTDVKQFDIEAWMPGQDEYRETHSCSNTTDFQARGINVKYRGKGGKADYVHMLNATGFAVGRMLIAIIENYQRKDGSVEVPRVLRSYVGKRVLK